MKEILTNVIGYNGRYRVSNTGIVISHNYVNPKEIKPANNNKGYPRIRLHKNGQQKTLLLKRVVYESFYGETKKTIHNINNDKMDCRLCNLIACDDRIIAQDLYYISKNKTPVHQYSISGEYIQSFSDIYKASKKTKININQIVNCVSGYSSSAGEYIFKKVME